MLLLLIGLQVHKSCAVDMTANCQKPDKLSNDNTKYTNVCTNTRQVQKTAER